MITLRRATMFRVVILLASLAQIVTLVVFHQLTVITPIGVAREAETRLVAELYEASRSGSHIGVETLCGIDGRVCYRGDALAIADRLEQEMLASGATARLLRDTAMRDRLVFTFTQAAFAGSVDEAMRHIRLVKHRRDAALIMVSQTGSTLAFGQMKIAFSILAVLFQQAWVTLALLILGRHGDWRLRRGRWVRDA